MAGTYSSVLSKAAKIVSEIDVLVSLALCVGRYDWVRPRLLPAGSQTIEIEVSFNSYGCSCSEVGYVATLSVPVWCLQCQEIIATRTRMYKRSKQVP